MSEADPRPATTGSCQCGAVAVRSHADSLWMAHCHCSQCRRAHGTGFVTWIGLSAQHTQIVDDAHALRWYASSPPAQRGFCSNCGSMLLFRSSRWPGELHLAAGALDGPPDRQPQAHVYWSDRVDWSGVADDDGLLHKD